VPATMTQRRIELPPTGLYRHPFEETDGQRVVAIDGATGPLTISDLAGRGKRIFFRPKGRIVGNYVVSRDFSLVIAAVDGPDSTRTFSVAPTDGTAVREIPGKWTGLAPCDPEISWDNRYILFCQSQPSGPSQLVRFSMTDGQISNIREADGSRYRFSPDSRFIAYESAGEIFVIPSQGGESQLVVDRGSSPADHGSLVNDWTRDGRYLIITTTNGGARSLNLLPMKDGRKAGEPVFVRYGNLTDGRTIASGAFIYSATPQSGFFTPWLGALNSAGGSPRWEKLGLTGSSAVAHFPTWSPDGTRMAYVAYDAAAGQYSQALRVRTMASGEERELYRSGFPMVCLWSLKHPSIICMQRAAPNTVLSVSTETGRAEPLGDIPGLDATTVPVLLTNDDRTVYLSSQRRGLMRWEIGSTQPTTVLEGPNPSTSAYLAAISPDGRWVTRWENGNIEIRPVSGGDWRPLAPVEARTAAAYTPDGNWFVYHDGHVGMAKDGLFRVATSGGQPERIGDYPPEDLSGVMWISPDGKQIIADTSNPQELWILENFETKQLAAK
jgi:Tol biopolymer transport system component